MRADLRQPGQKRVARYTPSMYRALVIVLLLVLAGLQYRLWIADGSWAEAHRLKVTKNELQTAIAEASARNKALQAEIDDLKSGKNAMEGRARSDIGMVKEGETFYLTVAPADADNDTARETRQSNPAALAN